MLWTARQKDGVRRIFNNAGYLTSIVDRNGNTTTIVVGRGEPEPYFQRHRCRWPYLDLQLCRDANPHLCTSVSDSVGTVATYNYDSSGRLTQVVYPDGSQFNFSYDTGNLILSVTDSLGQTLETHTYDSQNRGLSSAQASGVNQVSLYYSSSTGSPVVIYNSLGQASWAYFSTVAQRRYLTQPPTNVGCATCGYVPGSSFLLSASGDTTAFTDGNSNTTYYTYDSQGNVTSKSLPDAYQTGGYDIWQYTYNAFSEVLSVTDPLNQTTTNSYDSNGNLLSTTTPSPDGSTAGSVTSFTYDSHGELTRITDPVVRTRPTSPTTRPV